MSKRTSTGISKNVVELGARGLNKSMALASLLPLSAIQ